MKMEDSEYKNHQKTLTSIRYLYPEGELVPDPDRVGLPPLDAEHHDLGQRGFRRGGHLQRVRISENTWHGYTEGGWAVLETGAVSGLRSQ